MFEALGKGLGDMTKFIYKYLSPGVAHLAMPDPKCMSFKCSHPKDFNDPYELFLTIDYSEDPGVLAFYNEIIGELPQLPVTCFSLSPTVTPMWAHYAQNSQGFVVELIEDAVHAECEGHGFGSVEYRDEPGEELKSLLYHAYHIGKPRYLFLLQRHVFSSAYYTKMRYWSYEKERRMIVAKEAVRDKDGALLIDVPGKCISSIIVGQNASIETKAFLEERASQLGCNFLEMKIGRTTAAPYFFDKEDSSYVFDGEQIVKSTSFCSSCKEPLRESQKKCSWCEISEAHVEDAANRNIFRAFSHLGILDDYLKDMAQIGKGNRGDA